jgi:hypothetical protein
MASILPRSLSRSRTAPWQACARRSPGGSPKPERKPDHRHARPAPRAPLRRRGGLGGRGDGRRLVRRRRARRGRGRCGWGRASGPAVARAATARAATAASCPDRAASWDSPRLTGIRGRRHHVRARHDERIATQRAGLAHDVLVGLREAAPPLPRRQRADGPEAVRADLAPRGRFGHHLTVHAVQPAGAGRVQVGRRDGDRRVLAHVWRRALAHDARAAVAVRGDRAGWSCRAYPAVQGSAAEVSRARRRGRQHEQGRSRCRPPPGRLVGCRGAAAGRAASRATAP